MLRREFGIGMLAAPFLVRAASAQTSRITVAKEYGLPYLPLLVMEQEKLIEKHAAGQGVPSLSVNWQTFGGPAALMDGMLSGTIDFSGPGVPALATAWDKTAGTVQEIRALCALQSMPYVLVTRNPAVRTIADFTDQDRIALPTVKLVGHALALEMAAARLWGFEHYDKLDPLTVSLAHPEAMRALLSGKSEINSHFASAPFYYYELKTPGIHKVMKSYDNLDGAKHTNGLMLTTKKFHDANPPLCAAMLAALQEANAYVKANPRDCAERYLAVTGDKQSPLDEVVSMVTDPDVDYTTVPANTMVLVDFMHRVGRIKKRPESWKDMFFPEAFELPGS